MERRRIAEATKGVGKPKVGGPFELIDQKRTPFSSEDMKGKYALVSPSLRHGAFISFYKRREMDVTD
jgi:protein SCO1/2